MHRFFFDFTQRIRQLYPTIYEGGTSEGKASLDYFKQWGWIASIDALAHGKRWKWDYFLNMNIYELHLTLAHFIDKNKMESAVRKQNLKR